MKTKSFITCILLIFCIASCQKAQYNNSSNFYDSLCAVKPMGWNCNVFQNELDTLPMPDGIFKPLAIVKYTCPFKTFSGINQVENPSLFLYIYDISKKGSLEKIMKKMMYLSSCIPEYYGENDQYYVITSPCYINGGCFTIESKELIKPLHQALKAKFVKYNPSLIDQEIR